MGLSVSNGKPVGNIQLFSKAKKSSQYIPGYAATFSNIKVDGASKESVIFLFVQKGSSNKLIVGEVERGEQDKPFGKCFRNRRVTGFYHGSSFIWNTSACD